jgi:hypothetical protein
MEKTAKKPPFERFFCCFYSIPEKQGARRKRVRVLLKTDQFQAEFSDFLLFKFSRYMTVNRAVLHSPQAGRNTRPRYGQRLEAASGQDCGDRRIYGQADRHAPLLYT